MVQCSRSLLRRHSGTIVGVSDLGRTPTPIVSRRAFLGFSATSLGVAIASSVAGCGSWQPKPDPVLEAQWARALADQRFLAPDDGSPAAGGADISSEVAAWLNSSRGAAAEAIGVEVERSCGVHPNGTVSQSCAGQPDYDPEKVDQLASSTETTIAAVQSPVSKRIVGSRGTQQLLDALDARTGLKEEYETLLAASVDGGLVLAARELSVPWDVLVPQLATPESLGGKSATVNQALISEYELIYAAVATIPQLEGSDRTNAMDSADRHRLIRDRVVAALELGGITPPTAQPGYLPTDSSENPNQIIAQLEQRCAQAWRDVVLTSADGGLRLFALQAAGLAQAGSAIFQGKAEAFLPGLEEG